MGDCKQSGEMESVAVSWGVMWAYNVIGQEKLRACALIGSLCRLCSQYGPQGGALPHDGCAYLVFMFGPMTSPEYGQNNSEGLKLAIFFFFSVTKLC